VWRERSDVQGFTTYALMLQCVLGAERIKIVASFDSRVVELWMMQKMLGQFSFVMQQLAKASLGMIVAEISTLTTQDVEQLWKWNQDVPAAVDRCIHDLVEEQATKRPEAPAVCAWDGKLTYGELNDYRSSLYN
jgi:hypothetical protein